jgi:hypothetical protein
MCDENQEALNIVQDPTTDSQASLSPNPEVKINPKAPIFA